VATQDGTYDLYRLDERGGDPRLLDVADMPERFATGFAGRAIPGLRNVTASAALLLADVGSGAPPFIVESNGYRLVERHAVLSVVDLSTGDTVLTYEPLDGPPAADTWFEFGSDTVTVTDPASGTVLMQIPVETYRSALDARETIMSSGGTDDIGDFRLLASRDGERFFVERLGSDDPNSGIPIDAATNDDVVLVRFGDEWIRYELR
jgi:hypothetical protein